MAEDIVISLTKRECLALIGIIRQMANELAKLPDPPPAMFSKSEAEVLNKIGKVLLKDDYIPLEAFVGRNKQEN